MHKSVFVALSPDGVMTAAENMQLQPRIKTLSRAAVILARDGRPLAPNCPDQIEGCLCSVRVPK